MNLFKIRFLFYPILPGLISLIFLFSFGITSEREEQFWIVFIATSSFFVIFTFIVYWIIFRKALVPLKKLNDHFDKVLKKERGLAEPPEYTNNTVYDFYIDKYNKIVESFRLSFIDILNQTAGSISESSKLERKLRGYDKSLEKVLFNQDRMVEEFSQINSEIQNQAKTAGALEQAGLKINRFLNELNRDSSSVMGKAEDGLKSLEASEEHLNRLGRFIKGNQEYTGHLVKRLSDIESIIVSIKELADRTNLLSLNASIEAARAGDLGRGFAVVASEVNKLADQSQESVGEIAKTIESLVKDIQDSARQVDEISAEMDTLHEIGKQSFSGFRSILDSVERISNEVHEITDEYQDLNTGINFMSDSSAHIHERTDDVRSRVQVNRKYVSLLTSDIHSLAENMEEANEKSEDILKSLQQYGILSSEELRNQMHMAKESHTLWISNLERLFNPDEKDSVDLETNPKRCRFGVFYHNSPVPAKCTNEWESIGDLHDRIHNSATTIQDLLDQGKEEEAYNILNNTKSYSSDLMKLLQICNVNLSTK